MAHWYICVTFTADPKNSLRYSGMVLLVTVDYTNDGHPSSTRYTYRVAAIPNADYKMFEVQSGVNNGLPRRNAEYVSRAIGV